MKKKILTIIFLSFILIFAVLTVALPKKARSENEKRLLADFPQFSMATITDGSFMSGLDTYLSDHFAFREKWVGLYSYARLSLGFKENGGIIACDDGYLINAPGEFDKEKAQKNIDTLQSFTKRYDLDANILVVPTAGYIMDDVLPKYHSKYWDDELFDIVNESSMNLIDVRDTLKSNKDNQLYYKTDHHITSFAAYLLYKDYCKAENITPDTFKKDETIDGFYGTTYSKSGLWLKSPDTIDIYKSTTESSFIVTIDDKKYDSLLFRDQLNGTDKYQVFLDGNHDITYIKNLTNSNLDKKLLIIKDSYAHCFTTFLAENYNEIVMLDMRYYRKSVKKLMEEENFSEVLFLFGTDNLATSTDFGWLNF